MGTKSWVLKRTPKRGSQNWVDFFKKKRISHYVFACFVQLGSKFGVLLSTRQYIYMCIYIYLYLFIFFWGGGMSLSVSVFSRDVYVCMYIYIWLYI